MDTNASLCALCDLRHLTTSSTHWCPECQEALCINCNEHHSLSKSSRSHQVIPISEYIDLPSCIANIDLFCTYHNEKYIQYCVKHECPICYKCIKEHGKCSELVLLEELTHEVKSSEPFRDMEQCLTDVKININRIRIDSKSNIELIARKKKQIIEEVSRLKSQIIQHLDKLQEDLMKELDEVENKCCVNIASNISSVDDQDKEILQCNTEIENMKKYASDIQTFLGMKDLQQKITKHEKFIQSLIEKKKLERVELEFINNSTIQKFLSDDMRFGSITVNSCPSAGIELVRKKHRQAQISITDKKQSVHKVKLLFRQSLKTSCGNTSGGCATANGEFLFINYQISTEKLVVVGANGKIKYDIPLSKPYSSFDITCLDDKTVAVSTGESDDKTGIIILDLSTRAIKEFVALPSQPFGLTFDGKSLICCCDQKDIHLISCTDYNITTIVDTVLPECSYITTYADKIFYTNPKENEVSCSSYSGELVWKFKNERTLKTPRGITVDDKGNIFVVGKNSKNILVISNDGKQYTQIQTSQYGLPEPRTIFFDKIRKKFVVSNEVNFAHLYDISYW